MFGGVREFSDILSRLNQISSYSFIGCVRDIKLNSKSISEADETMSDAGIRLQVSRNGVVSSEVCPVETIKTGKETEKEACNGEAAAGVCGNGNGCLLDSVAATLKPSRRNNDENEHPLSFRCLCLNDGGYEASHCPSAAPNGWLYLLYFSGHFNLFLTVSFCKEQKLDHDSYSL